VEYWYRHHISIQNIVPDSKHGAALRHLHGGDLSKISLVVRGGRQQSINLAQQTEVPFASTQVLNRRTRSAERERPQFAEAARIQDYRRNGLRESRDSMFENALNQARGVPRTRSASCG
jgi:hypothetical protein